MSGPNGKDPAPFVVYGIAGSLRTGSWNRKLLDAAARLAPEGVEVRISDLVGELPLLNEDLDGDELEPVMRMRADVAAADAVLIATPEYNGGVPGVLKNALDWLSLPLGASVLQHKPVGLMGASPGPLGTARCLWDLRNTFIYSRSPVPPSPEVMLRNCWEHFDENGDIVNEETVKRITLLYLTLQAYAQIPHVDVAGILGGAAIKTNYPEADADADA